MKDNYYIRDLCSVAGTFIKIKKQRVLQDMLFAIGKIELRIKKCSDLGEMDISIENSQTLSNI